MGSFDDRVELFLGHLLNAGDLGAVHRRVNIEHRTRANPLPGETAEVTLNMSLYDRMSELR